MALSPAEKSQRWRERQRVERDNAIRLALDNLQADIFKRPFFETGVDSGFDLPLALAGIDAPTFDDDRGPEDFVLNGATEGVESPFAMVSRGSLGRAELIIACLTDAAMELAAAVNEYKRSEIKARMAEIEERDLSDLENKKAAFNEIARLNKMLDQLTKQVRWTFPQWEVKG